jgi:hypothetical protein
LDRDCLSQQLKEFYWRDAMEEGAGVEWRGGRMTLFVSEIEGGGSEGPETCEEITAAGYRRE